MSASNLNPSSSLTHAPWDQPWPANELERVSSCPVCGSADRKLLHENLIDNVFYCAPGKWTSWRCSECRCSYLDPRPSQASIHLAYGTYYTHQEAAPKSSYAALSPFRKFRRRLVNGYTNWRYSTDELPATRMGRFALMIAWPLKTRLDREYRHLPRLPAGGSSLLDVGCGNGSFLQIARACGWNVVGIDPDPKAVANGLRQGLNVIQGGIEHFEGKSAMFDVITLNHVIEHVHDPVAVLKACYRLLKPTGSLWLETPNIDSLGHRHYMKNWRGLETPRHLVLFNQNSLTKALTEAGFSGSRRQSRPSPLFQISKSSEAIEQGLPLEHDIQLSISRKWMLSKYELMQAIVPSSKEFLTVVALKLPFSVEKM